MPLDPAGRQQVAQFRERFEARYAGDGRFHSLLREDRPDDSTLATRFEISERLWLELAIRPFVPQVRAGIVTDDRWKNEDLEQVIEDSGDEMVEFVEAGFDEAGLTWREPPVEHYREGGKLFYFSTGFELTALDDLAQPAVFDKACRMFDGYYEAFRPALRRT